MKLEYYVEIHDNNDDGDLADYTVWFTIGNQSFQIAGELEGLEEAEWWRDKFLHALRVMVSEVTDS